MRSMFDRTYLFSWRHLEINSVLLLRLLALWALIMWSFPVRFEIASLGNIVVGACTRNDRPAYLVVFLVVLEFPDIVNKINRYMN